jgi:hypothetical protein
LEENRGSYHDANFLARCQARTMSDPLRVYVDFDAGRDPIAGTVTTAVEQRAFTGWLGLIAGLEKAIGDRDEDGRDAGAPAATTGSSAFD